MNVKQRYSNRHLLFVLVAMVLFALILAACGAPAAPVQPTAQPSVPPATPTPQPVGPTEAMAPATQTAASPTPGPTATVPAPAFVSQPSGKKTASEFECPEPQPKLPVTSKELNL